MGKKKIIMKIKILLAEDERMLAEILSDTLGDRNFEVVLAYDGAKALEMAPREQFDVIVTDVMMPNIDGFTLVKKLRAQGCKTPVLFLTARNATDDVVKGFELGGDDYLKKPFAIDELIVRIKALAARGKTSAHTEETKRDNYKLGKFAFTPSTNTLAKEDLSSNAPGSADSTAYTLTTKLAARESAVLEYLCINIGETVEASSILKDLWGDDNFFNLRSLNVYITRLRNRLKDDPSIEIANIRNVGYRLVVHT